MDEAIFPPAVNWFLSKNLSCKKDGSIVYGAKNNVVILHGDPERIIFPSVIENAHDLRVTAVSFPPKNCCDTIQNTVVSCGDDGYVRIWDTSTLSLLADQKLHWDSKEQKGKVICLDWSEAEPEIVVSAGENDTLVSWNVLTNSGAKFHFPRMQPTVISCRPDREKIVAVGSKSGLVFVVNLVEGGKILFKLRGHDSEVQSLSWCPCNRNVFQEVNGEEKLLATSCKDPDIYIWRAGSDGGCETILRLPSNPLSKFESGQEKQRLKGSSTSNFVALYWAEPFTLFSNTVFGEMVICHIEDYVHLRDTEKALPKQSKSKTKDSWKSACDFHSRGIFAICGITTEETVADEEKISNGNIEDDTKVARSSSWIWSTGTDRKLILCKLVDGHCELIRSFNTLNGFPYCAAASPHDPNRIAIAVGDGVLRLWNLTETEGDLRIFWQKIKDKVMWVEWHPTKDGLVAYGTSEGRVGCVETQTSKMPILFKIVHPQPVYRLSWGPFYRRKDEESNKKDLALYSICNSNLFQYDLSKPDQAPLNLSKILNLLCGKQTDVSWKPDFSLLAVGNEDGTICLLSPPHLEPVAFVTAYKKTIQSIAWHPVCTAFDQDVSPYCGYFATGTTDKDNDIQVFDCLIGETEVSVKKMALLKGHKGYIQHVSWSPHVGGRLISSSADCTVRIWDVIAQNLLVVFVPNKLRMPLFSVWSPVDPDLIITGCRNKQLLVWRISAAGKETYELPDVDANKKADKKKKKMKKLNTSKAVLSEISKDVKEKHEEKEKEKENDKDKFVATAKQEKTVQTVRESKMFSDAWKGTPEDPKTCYELLKQSESNGKYNLGFLGNEAEWTEVIDNEENIRKKSNNWQELYEISLWRGNLKETVEEGIKSGRLTDFLVSLAPMVSPRLWQEACIAYSKNLAEQKQYRKAASYLVACHKIKEAVELLVNADLFLEALCIARCRFDKKDDEIKNIIQKYAGWLSKTGCLTRACECFIYLKDYVEAAKIMGKRNEAQHLSVAALAAKTGDCDRLESSYAMNGILKCLECQNFDLALTICEDHPNLKYLKILYHTYDSISKLNDGQLELDQDILRHIKSITGTETDEESYAALRYPYDKNVFYKKKSEMTMCIARELALACCSPDKDTTLTHAIQALSASLRYIPEGSTDLPLLRMCRWLAPSGYLVEGSLFNLTDALESKTRSLRAFLCEALIQEIETTTDDSSRTEIFKTLESLKDDLFDPVNMKYFKNLVEIKAYEKKILDVRFKRKTPSAELPDSDFVESENGEKDCESVLDLEILNGLKKEVEEFESRKVICPNPLISLCKIRNVVQQFPEGQNLLKEIEESPFGKSLIC